MKILNETNYRQRMKKRADRAKEKANELANKQEKPEQQTQGTENKENSLSSETMNDLKRAFKNAKSFKEQASYGREMFNRGLSGTQRNIENIQNLNKAFGDEDFSHWITSFNPDSIADNSNDFMVFLNNVTTDKFDGLIEDISSFVKLYNSYVRGNLENINSDYINSNEAVIYDKDLYDNDQDSINEIISIDLNNSDKSSLKNAKEKVKKESGKNLLYNDNGKLRSPGEINSLLNKYLGDSGNNRIVINNYNLNDLSDKQFKNIVTSIVSTERGRKLLQDAINGN